MRFWSNSGQNYEFEQVYFDLGLFSSRLIIVKFIEVFEYFLMSTNMSLITLPSLSVLDYAQPNPS